MFQFALPATLFRLRVRGPAFRPLLQLPNASETAPKENINYNPLFIIQFY
nr:MAG TPA: hypothetical protein [Caudoviricetes sp.]